MLRMLLFRPHALKYTCRRCCLLSEVNLWKLLISRCSYCFWVLPECILTTRSCSLKALLSAFAVVTVLWPFIQMFSRHSSPELREILLAIFLQTLIWHTAALNTDAVQHCTWDEACCHITSWLRYTFTCNKPSDFIVQVCCCWCLSYIPIWAVWESLHSRELDVVFGPYNPQF